MSYQRRNHEYLQMDTGVVGEPDPVWQDPLRRGFCAGCDHEGQSKKSFPQCIQCPHRKPHRPPPNQAVSEPQGKPLVEVLNTIDVGTMQALAELDKYLNSLHGRKK
jgi:hypothetical protein